MRPGNKQQLAFTLIELMVVISIIGFLASVVLVALAGGRQKARDTKRVSDMTQMVKALELYFLTNRGYPTSTTPGVPDNMVPDTLASLPISPTPADSSVCNAQTAPSPANPANSYYYQPQGTSYVVNGVTVYPSYSYYFCIGNQTANLAPGVHTVSPTGIQ